MKKIFLIITLLFISSALSLAQKFEGGVMAGIAGTQTAGDGYSGFKKAGAFGGAWVRLPFTPHSAFQMELEYFQKGARKNPDPENDDYEQYLFRANYIEMPILYQYKFTDRISAEIGPSLGFLINYYERVDELEIHETPGYNVPARITLQFNLGIYVYLTDNLAFNFRTNNSLLNIRSENRTGDVYRLWGYGQFHDSLVLSLFYQIRRGK